MLLSYYYYYIVKSLSLVTHIPGPRRPLNLLFTPPPRRTKKKKKYNTIETIKHPPIWISGRLVREEALIDLIFMACGLFNPERYFGLESVTEPNVPKRSPPV